MRKNIVPSFLVLFCLFLLSAMPNRSRPRVLIFSKTNGYHHASIPAGIAAIKKLGAENGFDVDDTTDSLAFNKKNLKKYAAIIFLSPTGTVFGPDQEAAFQEFIQHGGGFVGIHAATDCEYNWSWYGELVGAYFKSHPKQQQAKLIIVDKNNAATAGLPDPWVRFDEWYNFKNLSDKTNVLLKIDETSYAGGENSQNHPMAWYHDFDGGRAFYTALGHTDESFSDSNYLHHILGGIKYAIGH
ncbi:MAG: Crp/Fnr family transcriptional regulator [Bacteroidetes bacterium]|nr:MAG: Crp/Fnr family transcriptional regulator [Bacteroidota bacterium]